MALTSEDLQEAHNRGQEDGYNNRYDPPIKWFNVFFASEQILLQEAYDKGWEHGKSQR